MKLSDELKELKQWIEFGKKLCKPRKKMSFPNLKSVLVHIPGDTGFPIVFTVDRNYHPNVGLWHIMTKADIGVVNEKHCKKNKQTVMSRVME